MSWANASQLWSLIEGKWDTLTTPKEGRTAGGVLDRYYLPWCVQRGRPAVWPPTEESRNSYLYDTIWTPRKCFLFPDDADSVTFQMFGNLPWVEGNQCLQRALGVADDGEIGPVTLGAIRKWDAATLSERILEQQEAHYQANGGDDLKGLLDRVATVRSWLAGRHG